MIDAPKPIAAENRIDFLDILRGVAVLAIFSVNIKAMFLPFPFYSNATLWPGEYDMIVAALQAFLIDDKWRTIFTMLFGAGIALIATRAHAKGETSLGLLIRRLFFLGVFGLIHLFLIWTGDILFTYASVGLIALWFRHASKTVLFWTTVFSAVVGLVWTTAFNAGPAIIPEIRAEIEPFLWGSDPQWLQDTIEEMRSGVGAHLSNRWVAGQDYLFFYYLLGGHWLETLAIMLGGMWAYKCGFFSGTLASSTYRDVALIGIGGAFTIDLTRWALLNYFDWSFVAYSFMQPLNQIDGYFAAAGYSGLIGLWVKAGWRPRALAATGRMAFTNYIACSLIGTTLAYGHGGGLFGLLTNLQLMGIVAATWIAILIWSPLWLARYRFGPLEWFWRSLTYGRVQPFRR